MHPFVHTKMTFLAPPSVFHSCSPCNSNSIHFISFQFNSIQFNSLRAAAVSATAAYLTDVTNVHKHFKPHGFETDFEQLGEIRASFPAIRKINVVGQSFSVGSLTDKFNLLRCKRSRHVVW